MNVELLPASGPGTVLRILATNDLGATLVPVPTSFGASGTCAGIVALLERERERQPTVWLDAGDFTFGPVAPLLGRRPWDEIAALPIAAAAAGNHDFDDGVDALLDAAESLPFPLLCANVGVGLPATTLVETAAGPLGVIGLTTPHLHRLTAAPAPPEAWADRIPQLAGELRAAGARWVVALQHEGAAWWPEPPAIAGRPDRWARYAEPVAPHVDLLLGGHILGAWAGRIAGTPAGHAFAFESSVLVVDLPAPPAEPVIRGCARVPPLRPQAATPAVAAVDAAVARIVGSSRESWLGRTGADRYLPDLVAAALREATGADAALVPGGQHNAQAPIDGAISSLRAGPITELDLYRLFPYADDRPVVVTVRPGEFAAAREAHDAVADPRPAAADHVWWNAIRMPAGHSTTTGDPEHVAMMPFVVSRLSELLGRDLQGETAGVGGREALAAAVTR